MTDAEWWQKKHEEDCGSLATQLHRRTKEVSLLRGLLEEWLDTEFFNTRKKWEAWREDFGTRVEQALNMLYRKAERSEAKTKDETPTQERHANFTTLFFQTEKEARDYVTRRSVNPRDNYGVLRPDFDPTGEDDLFLRVGHSLAEQPNGSWKLVF